MDKKAFDETGKLKNKPVTYYLCFPWILAFIIDKPWETELYT